MVTGRRAEERKISALTRHLAHLWYTPRRIFGRRKLHRTTTERVNSFSLRIDPFIWNPKLFRSGRYFASEIERLAKIGDRLRPWNAAPHALDVGTGSGLLALTVARMGYWVTGVDVNPNAVECARFNAKANNLTHAARFLCGDLFAPVEGEKFDLILCSLPKFRGAPKSEFEISWCSPDVIDRFAAAVGRHLNPDGLALVLLTTHGDDEGMLEALEANGLHPKPVAQKHFGVEIFTIFMVAPDPL